MSKAERELLESIAASVRKNITDAVDGQTLKSVAERTGLDRHRVADILAGATPDSYEIMVFQTVYHRQIWPGPR